MELTVLGRSGRYPEKNGGTSAYLLRTNSTTLLMDMGSGSIAGFQNYIGIEDIDGILFSHLHGDHMADFLPFNYMVAFLKDRLTHPIDVYLPNEPKREVERLVYKSSQLDFHFIEDNPHVKIGDIDIEFLETKHPVKCYAMRIKAEGSKTLLYTADTTLFEGIEHLFEGADVILGDACVLRSEWSENSPHLSVYDLACFARDNNAHLILTHLPDNEEDISKVYYEAKSVTDDVEVAKVKATYNI